MTNKHPDKLTYWKAGETDYTGQPVWGPPTLIYCRWEDEQKIYLTATGREERGRSVIYAKFGGLEIGDYVINGESLDTEPPYDAFEVKQPRRIKNLRGTRVEYRYIV